MPKVKTLKAHSNRFGVHAEGDVYAHPAPKIDIHFGHLELVPLADQTVAEIEAEAERREVELPTKGTGKRGRAVKANLVEAVEKG